ncbi:MAG: envelope stress response protein PspG [Pseudomonadaceae bacterium]|nr:envelope stress response protein PspG [Pseudomonadaceae bacterium]
MFRLLFWIAVIAAAVWLWRRFKRPAAPSADTAQQDPAPMVRCAQCGVHVPRDQALAQGERWYCSQAHLQQGSPRQ